MINKIILCLIFAYLFSIHIAHCLEARIGASTYYENLKVLDSTYNNIGGSIDAFVGTHWRNGLYLGATFRFGVAKSYLQNYSDVAYKIGFVPEIGYMFAIKNPIFLSLYFPLNGDILLPHLRREFQRTLIFAGINMTQRIYLSKNIDLEYKLGYGFNILTRHKSYTFNDSKWFHNMGQHIVANIATIIKSDTLEYRISLDTTYYHLESFSLTAFDNITRTYNASDNFMIGLGFGCAF